MFTKSDKQSSRGSMSLCTRVLVQLSWVLLEQHLSMNRKRRRYNLAFNMISTPVAY